MIRLPVGLNRIPRLFLGGIALLFSVGSASAEPASPLMEEHALTVANLRGYGPVSAVTWKSPGGGTLLEIVAQDAEKAKLTQSKYLSDLGLLPGVKDSSVAVGGSTVSAREVEGQGWVAALRKDSKIYIAAAPDRTAFDEVLNHLPGTAISACSSTPESAVPMWLDRWDRFGFRFYYRPWETPSGGESADYDIPAEFDFAEKNDRSGFVFWANQNAIDTAEGLTNETWWNWAAAEAEKKNLPVGLNIAVGGPGSSWLFNRYRDQTAQKMPQYCGGYYTVAIPDHGGNGWFSWNSTIGKDADLAGIQQIIARMAARPNLVSVLEPHGELRHGSHDIFLEYGPVADEGFQRFLEKKHQTLEALNSAWETSYSSWGEVRVPEIASFLGWGDRAIDLTGKWRINHETAPGSKEVPPQAGEATTPPEWFEEGFDDSAWAEVTAPGTDRTMFLPKQPAVYRRTFDVSAEWLEKHAGAWLYLWDLNLGSGENVKVALNGDVIGESTLRNAQPHWGALDVRKLLRPGTNQLTIRLPKGYLAYRVYLSADEPRQYPALGKSRNAQWVDFIDWMNVSRVSGAARGMEMIRQVAPNQPITLMAPDSYVDGIRRLAKDYGGNFHNTGYMGAFWADLLPAVMRGAGLPFSLEPGGPAPDLPVFKYMIGLYSTEGIQGLDYFIHVGNVMWLPEIRSYFEDHLREIKLLGKYHAPPAEVAALYSTQSACYTGYPWGQSVNTNLGAGYWQWNVRAYLRDRYESDGLTESSFEEGDASRYKVVIDTNTSIMDDALLAQIEKYVSEGGTFVTFVQTGRHTPTEPDSWPISRLTGFHVVGMDALNDNGSPATTRSFRPAPDQDVFTGDWSKAVANGLTLEKVAPDAVPLLLWEDGTVAAGMRKVGKGTIIQLGAKFTGKDIADRIEPSGKKESPPEGAPMNAHSALKRLLGQILEWKKITPVVAEWEPQEEYILLRHYLSNNGLYDVWTVWNQNRKSPATGAIVLTSDHKPAWAIAVRDGQKVPVTDQRIAVELGPLETRVYLTPRNAIGEAPLAWFDLQRNWWRATAQPSEKPLPKMRSRFSLDLDPDWAFKSLADGESGEPLVGADVDDSGWERIPLGIWSLPDKKDIRHALLRKKFQVPSDWKNGAPALWLKAWFSTTFVDRGRIWLDGNLISDWSSEGVTDVDPKNSLVAGSTHTLAVEIESKSSLAGTRGDAWLWFWPQPASSIDLSGMWVPSPDVLHDKAPIKLPGPYSGRTLRREVEVPAGEKGKNVVVRADATGSLAGVLVNGHWVQRFHHIIGTRFDLNVTPWIRFGEKNTIELVSPHDATQGRVKTVRLDFHKPENYP